MLQITLYTTEHCHLCDDAKAIIIHALNTKFNQTNYNFNTIDICNDEALYELYSLEIPVLNIHTASARQITLKWPFNNETILNALSI